mgnify:CR=1 FL=1
MDVQKKFWTSKKMFWTSKKLFGRPEQVFARAKHLFECSRNLLDVRGSLQMAPQQDNQGRIILDALFGKRLQNLSGGTPSIYMRKTNEPQSWLTKGELEIRNGVLDWLSVILTSIQRERIKRVLITSRDGNELKLTYDTTFERFEIENLPNDREIKSRFQLLNIGIIPENLCLLYTSPSPRD